MDITYIPMCKGFVYLAAVLDWATHLEGDPNSLPALYLAGALSWQIPARQNQAMGYFRRGFQQGREQGLALDTLLTLFYRAGAAVDAEEAVRWLNGLAPRTTDSSTLLNWVQTWEPLLGSDSPAYRALHGLAKVRALHHRLSGPLQELKSLANWIHSPPERPRRVSRHIVP